MFSTKNCALAFALNAITALGGVGNALAAENFAEFIVGNCYHNIDDLSRIESFARIMNWEPMSADMLQSVKPTDTEGYSGWIVRQDATIYLLAINRGNWKDGRKANICSVVVNTDRDKLVESISALMPLKKIAEDRQPMQMLEIFEVESKVVEQTLFQILSTDDGKPPVNAGFVGIVP